MGTSSSQIVSEPEEAESISSAQMGDAPPQAAQTSTAVAAPTSKIVTVSERTSAKRPRQFSADVEAAVRKHKKIKVTVQATADKKRRAQPQSRRGTNLLPTLPAEDGPREGEDAGREQLRNKTPPDLADGASSRRKRKREVEKAVLKPADVQADELRGPSESILAGRKGNENIGFVVVHTNSPEPAETREMPEKQPSHAQEAVREEPMRRTLERRSSSAFRDRREAAEVEVPHADFPVETVQKDQRKRRSAPRPRALAVDGYATLSAGEPSAVDTTSDQVAYDGQGIAETENTTPPLPPGPEFTASEGNEGEEPYLPIEGSSPVLPTWTEEMTQLPQRTLATTSSSFQRYTEDTSSQRGQDNGAFTKEEKDLASTVFHDYCLQHNVLEEDLRRAIMQWGTVGEFKTSMYEAFPRRTLTAIRKLCQRRFSPFVRGSWTAAQDDALRSAYAAHPDNWRAIGDVVERLPGDCRDRYQNTIRYGGSMERGPWSQAEEEKLRQAVEEAMLVVRRNAPHEHDLDKMESMIS